MFGIDTACLVLILHIGYGYRMSGIGIRFGLVWCIGV